MWLSSCLRWKHGGVEHQGSVRVTARCLMQQEWRVYRGGRSQGWKCERKASWWVVRSGVSEELG